MYMYVYNYTCIIPFLAIEVIKALRLFQLYTYTDVIFSLRVLYWQYLCMIVGYGWCTQCSWSKEHWLTVRLSSHAQALTHGADLQTAESHLDTSKAHKLRKKVYIYMYTCTHVQVYLQQVYTHISCPGFAPSFFWHCALDFLCTCTYST